MSEETSNQKQPQPQPQHVTSWPGKQVETLRLWEEAVKARKKGKMRHPVLKIGLENCFHLLCQVIKIKKPQLGESSFLETGNTVNWGVSGNIKLLAESFQASR